MIRTTALAAVALGAMAMPALALETHLAPAPHASAAFTNMRIFTGMLPETTSEPFHFGAAEPRPLTPDQPAISKPTVIYDVGAGKPASRIDITDPRDNPFMPQFERTDRAPYAAH